MYFKCNFISKIFVKSNAIPWKNPWFSNFGYSKNSSNWLLLLQFGQKLRENNVFLYTDFTKYFSNKSEFSFYYFSTIRRHCCVSFTEIFQHFEIHTTNTNNLIEISNYLGFINNFTKNVIEIWKSFPNLATNVTVTVGLVSVSVLETLTVQ